MKPKTEDVLRSPKQSEKAMNNLLANLQTLGDAEHDDLSVAHDALAEIVRLRLLNAELVEALQAMEKAGEWAGTEWAVPASTWRKASAALAEAKGEICAG